MLPPSVLNDLIGVVDAEANRARVAARGAVIRIIGCLLAALLFIGAASVLAVGGYRELAASYDDLTAAAVVAAGFLSLGAIVLAVVLLVANRRARRRAEAQAAIARAALSGDVVRMVSGFQSLGLPPLMIGAGAVLAGIVAGYSTKQRSGTADG
ncbi:MAG: hypothetical protein ACMVY4_06905 [Minwuia sp.]|uniref:hypothetical protein n=1 Tax=Minwuia sp. TaxID=2493630 RepID=UPI003A8C034D